QTKMDIKGFLSELRRRNVPKSAIAYLVVAWMVVQVCSILFPVFNAPDWVLRSLVIILIVGFPLWIIFSWIYDISSQGIEKTLSHNSKLGPVNTEIGNRLNKTIIICLSIAVVLLVYNQFSNKLLPSTLATSNKNGLYGTLAVMPLVNNKPDSATNYLGFAVANQIIGDLMYLKNLNVRSSHEVRKYDGKEMELTDLQNELNVDYVMLGNYLKEENHIRLNLELINLNTKELVWRSDNMEIDFQSTFALQDIVAKKVVNELNIKFSEREIEMINRDIPSNPLAYEYYLKSSSYPLTTEGDRLAIEMLRKSIEIDSAFAPAYADLGFRNQRLTMFEMLGNERLVTIENYYLKALELNPVQLSALGYLSVFYTETNRIEPAIELTRKMLDINPNHASALFSLGYLYRYIGMLDESVALMEKALSLDPNNQNYYRIGVSYLSQLEYEKALDSFLKGDDTPYFLTWQAITFYRMGEFQKSLEALNKILGGGKEPYIYYSSLSLKAIIEGDYKLANESIKKLEEGSNLDSEGWYHWGVLYAISNNTEGALRCLRNATEVGYYNYPFMESDPLLNNLRTNPEFILILAKARDKHLYFKNKYFTSLQV
ncbi:MAG: tetratricopeptide repeat protein, partial [Flavobacteriaceae bacterium]|nr:tetratricopeptide repeat protein [Flavobacteriaceae bacterium]